MLVQFLISSKLCIEILLSTLDSSNLQSSTGHPDHDEKVLFFPALIRSSLRNAEHMQFQVGWCLDAGPHCSFGVTFVHRLLLHFAFKFALPKATEGDSAFERKCQVWKNGILWNTNTGLCALVEVVEESRFVIILLLHNFDSSANCLGRYLNELINNVLLLQMEYCPDLTLQKFAIHPLTLSYPIEKPSKLPLFDIPTLASCYKGDTQYLVSTDTTVVEMKTILPFDQIHVLQLLKISEVMLYLFFEGTICVNSFSPYL